jgi:hypothetical protein
MRTPWGASDYTKAYTEDIVFYGTPSHGGFRVEGRTIDRIPADHQTTMSGYGWYEEDCDWAIVAWFIPEFRDAMTAYLPADHPYDLIGVARQALASYNSAVLEDYPEPREMEDA